MSYRWGFDLIGMNWVDGLSHHLLGPDVAILRDEEDSQPPQYFFSSEHFDDLTDPSEVASRATALKILFDGAMFLQLGLDFSPERLGDLVDFEAVRRIGGVANVGGSAKPFSEQVLARTLSRLHERSVSSNRLEGAIFLSRTDNVARGILTVLGAHGPTFSSLYSLRDFMKTHGWDDARIADAAGVTKADLNLFTHTANNYEVSGPSARHGDLGHQPPTQPMTLERASEIILSATRLFIDERIRAETRQ